MKGWLKEPLLHFVLLGAAIFALDAAWSTKTARAGDDRIVVSAGRVENLAALFTKTWQRAPSALELRGLVDDDILEEALYREGKALGVDQGDTIIRRRVRQKMEFVVDDIIELVEPTQEQLAEWLAAHSDDYAHPARYRFRQIYLNPERHVDSLDADAQEVLAALRALDETTDPRGIGDPSLFEHAFPDDNVEALAAIFGERFVEELAGVAIGEWSGPIRSAFGVHLVHVERRTLAEAPDLEEVQAAVARDWAFAQRETASGRYRDELLARYQVEIEWPVEPGEGQTP